MSDWHELQSKLAAKNAQVDAAQVDRIAAAVHAEWVAGQKEQGITVAPWSKLSETAKELDRVTVRAVLKHISPAPASAPASQEERGGGGRLDETEARLKREYNSANAQNALERAQDLLARGEITVAEANVMMIRGEGVRLITNRLTRDLRTALNQAVRAGKLGHLPREGHKPEAYFKPEQLDRARDLRRVAEAKVFAVSRTVMAHQRDIDAAHALPTPEPQP